MVFTISKFAYFSAYASIYSICYILVFFLVNLTNDAYMFQRERVAAAEPTRQKKLKATDKELEKVISA